MKKWQLPSRDNKGEKILYINARIMDPESRLDIQGELLTVGSEIADYSIPNSGLESSADQIIDCEGHLLTPGLLDIHVHFREPGFEHKETIETGSKAAAAGGVTTVVCQPNTNPKIDNLATLKYVLSKTAYVNIESYATITKDGDSLTEMALLNEAGACGFTDDGLPVMNSKLMKQAFLYSRYLNVPIAQHAEDLTYTGCMNEGPLSEEMAVMGNPNISESIIVSRDIQILSTVEGAHYHVLHVSTKESLGNISQAKEKGMKVTCEVTPHHLLLTDEELRGYNCLGKVNPPLRSEIDRKSMIDGLKRGLINCIASDHAPHEKSSKETTLDKASFGMVGVETLLPLSMEFYHNGTLSLSDLIANLTYKPALIINKPIGRIKKGYKADLTLIDINKEWLINNSKLSSKSKNSPYNNRKVKGKVKRTIVSGATVFEDNFETKN